MKRPPRRNPRARTTDSRVIDNEVPLQVMVPARIRRQVGIICADRGENLRTTILRGLAAIGVEVPQSELVERRGRKRAE